MRFPLMSQKYESVFKCDHSGCPRAETPAVLHDSRHTWPSTRVQASLRRQRRVNGGLAFSSPFASTRLESDRRFVRLHGGRRM